MKKTLKLAVAASVLATPAMASNIPGPYNTLNDNMENPLYMPGQNMFYSKLSNGLMLKVADDSDAHKMKHHDGDIEWPIVRVQEDLGWGITDRWAVHGSVQYTHNADIDRTGLSAGRIGTTYRILNLYHGLVWDVYGDFHLGGLGKMRGQFNVTSMNPTTGVFDYDNYSNGKWGYHVGTKVGKVWDRLTTSAFVEVLRTIGNDNNEIRVMVDQDLKNQMLMGAMNGNPMATQGAMGILALPNNVSVDLKSTTEISAGANAFYQLSDRWSTGLSFRYNHHADNGVKKITSDLGFAEANRKDFEAMLKDMNDGFDEYIVGLSIANQVTDHAQVALYAEYTFDKGHPNSQNSTDAKAEAGVRLNFMF